MAIDTNYSRNGFYMEAGGITSATAIAGKGAEDMGLDDFMQLLVAQMTNQDIFDDSSSTEYVSQLAQFTVLSGIQTIQEYQLSSYAVSYVGKKVAIATTDDQNNLKTVIGQVTNVTFYNGEPMVVVDGDSYSLYKVMEIIAEGADSTYNKKDPDKTDKTDDKKDIDDDDEEVTEA